MEVMEQMERNSVDKEQQIKNIKQQIKLLVDNSLNLRERIFIMHYIEKKEYNKVRAYMESCVLSSQTKLLDSVLNAEYDPVYGARYKVVKKIDNLITYICQELI